MALRKLLRDRIGPLADNAGFALGQIARDYFVKHPEVLQDLLAEMLKKNVSKRKLAAETEVA